MVGSIVLVAALTLVLIVFGYRVAVRTGPPVRERARADALARYHALRERELSIPDVKASHVDKHHVTRRA